MKLTLSCVVPVFPQVTVHDFLKEKKITWKLKDIDRTVNKAEELDTIKVYTTQVDDLSVMSLFQEIGQQTGHPYQAWMNNRSLESSHWYFSWFDDAGQKQAPMYESSLYRESLFNTMDGVMVFPYQLGDTTEHVSGPRIKSCSRMSWKCGSVSLSGKAQLEGYHAARLTVGEFLETIKLFGFRMSSLEQNKTDPVPFEAVAKFIWEIESLIISTKATLKAFLSNKPWTNIFVYNDDWAVEKNYRVLAQLVRSMTRMRWGIFDGQHRALNLNCGYRGHFAMSSVVSSDFPTYSYIQPAADQPASVTAEMIDDVLDSLPNRGKKKFVYKQSYFTKYKMRIRVGTADKETLEEEFAILRSYGATQNAGRDIHIRQSIQNILVGWHETLQENNFEFEKFDENKLWGLKAKVNASVVIEPFNKPWFKDFCQYVTVHGLQGSLQRVAANTNQNGDAMYWEPQIKGQVEGKLRTPRYFLAGAEQECNNIPRITGAMFCVLKFVVTSQVRFNNFMKYISYASLEQPAMPQLPAPRCLTRLVSPDWFRYNFGFPVMMTSNFFSGRVVFEWKLQQDMALLETHSEALNKDSKVLRKHGASFGMKEEKTKQNKDGKETGVAQVLQVEPKVGKSLAKLKNLHVKRWQKQRNDKTADFSCLFQCYKNTPMDWTDRRKPLAPSNLELRHSSSDHGKYIYIFTGAVINGIFAEFEKRGPNPLIMSMQEAKEKANGRPVYENVLLDLYLR